MSRKRVRNHRQTSSFIPAQKQPQSQYDYILPQDETRVKREAYISAIIECTSDFADFPHRTDEEIQERAVKQCKQCSSNDTEKFNTLFIKRYIENYKAAEALYQADYRAFEMRKDLAACIQHLGDFFDQNHLGTMEVS